MPPAQVGGYHDVARGEPEPGADERRKRDPRRARRHSGPRPRTCRISRSRKAAAVQRVCRVMATWDASTSKRNSSISSSQHARKRLIYRFMRSHETAWLSVRSVTVRSERTPAALRRAGGAATQEVVVEQLQGM